MRTPTNIVGMVVLGIIAAAIVVGEATLRLRNGADLPETLLGVPGLVVAGLLGLMRSNGDTHLANPQA